MTELLIKCPLLDEDTGLCKGITFNIFKWPSKTRFGTGGGFCDVKDDISEQMTCTRHPANTDQENKPETTG